MFGERLKKLINSTVSPVGENYLPQHEYIYFTTKVNVATLKMTVPLMIANKDSRSVRVQNLLTLNVPIPTD